MSGDIRKNISRGQTIVMEVTLARCIIQCIKRVKGNVGASYEIFTLKVLTCDIGGQWSGKTPQCRYVDCGAPAQTSHGTVKLLNGTTTVGSLIEYTCQEDFWVDGEAKQECTKEGKWSHKTPQCELITCEEPEVPNGSYVVGYDLYIHSTIEYHCEEGYLLHGEAKHTCDKNGEWTGELPYCECTLLKHAKL